MHRFQFFVSKMDLFLKKKKTYFIWKAVTERESERSPMLWLVLQIAYLDLGTRSFTSECRGQELEPFFAAFQGHKQRARLEVELREYQPMPIWGAGARRLEDQPTAPPCWPQT